MSQRKSTASPQPRALDPAALFRGFDGLAELPRQQAAVACEAACAMFRGFEAMRKVQEQAAHAALARHSAAAERLKKPLPATELVGLQLELARFDLDAATHYWQALAAAAGEMSNEMAGCCAHLVDSAKVLEVAHSLDR